MINKTSKWFKLSSFFIILLAIDFIVKFYTFHHIPKMSWLYPIYPYGGIAVFKDFLGISFSINHVENLGAAWGVFAKYTSILFVLRIIIAIVLTIYLIFFNKDKRKDWPYTLIITGAIGNIIDFILYGRVIDMFHFNFWGYSYPLFNIADTMICIGILWLFIYMLVPEKKKI